MPVKTKIDVEELRSYLLDLCGTAMFSGLGPALIDVAEVEGASGEELLAITTLDLSGWDTVSVTDISYMSSGCSSLAGLDLSNWDVSFDADISYLFDGCQSLKSVDLTCWDDVDLRSFHTSPEA